MIGWLVEATLQRCLDSDAALHPLDVIADDEKPLGSKKADVVAIALTINEQMILCIFTFLRLRFLSSLW